MISLTTFCRGVAPVDPSTFSRLEADLHERTSRHWHFYPGAWLNQALPNRASGMARKGLA
jgi:hypothetical protein